MAGTQTRCPQCYQRIVVPQQSERQPDCGQYSLAGDGWPWAETAAAHPSAVCPACNTRFSAPAEWVGRELPCPECGRLAVVQPAKQAIKAKRATPGDYKVWEDYDPAKAQTASQAQSLVRMNCRICGAMMYAMPEEVGRQITCPDCGTQALVPPPPVPPPKTAANFRTPADEEYALADWRWQQPTEQGHRRLIPVICSNCNLRMYAYQWQVGLTVVCPDCARATVVPKPSEQPSPLGDSGTSAQHQFAEAAAAAPARKRSPRTVLAAAGGTVSGRSAGGWIAFLTQPEVLRIWAGLTATAFLVALLWFGVLWFLAGAQSVSPTLIAGACCLMLFTIVLAIWAVVAAVSFLAITCDTANGAPRITGLPGMMFLDWLGDSLYLFVPLSVSASIAGLLALARGQDRVLSDAPVPLPILAAWAVLPIFVLSALSAGSPLHVIARDVLRSFRLAPLSWLKYYAASFLLCLLFWGLWFLTDSATSTELGIVGLIVACGALSGTILIHARLLGILGRAVVRANSQWAEAREDAEAEEKEQKG